MSVKIESRLRKLEAKVPSDEAWKGFRVIGDTEAECQAGIDRLIETGEARAFDRFMCRLIVSPRIRIPNGQGGYLIAKQAAAGFPGGTGSFE